VRVDNERKQAAMDDAELEAAIQNIGNELDTSGRVLVRASGTEPLIRIMLEGQDEAVISRHAITLAKILERNHQGKIKS
jgi:phosphoglucosamine mutase